MILDQKIKIRSVILLDMVGALLSLTLSALVLPKFSNQTGLGKDTLWVFSSLAFICFVYGLYSFIAADRKAIWPLRGLVTLNSIFCIISGCVLFFSSTLNPLGRGVLILELMVVVAVVVLEISVLKKNETGEQS